MNGESSIARKMPDTIKDLEVVEREFNLYKLNSEKKNLMGLLDATARKILTVDVENVEELEKLEIEFDAVAFNFEVVKEAHGIVNGPIYSDIYHRETQKKKVDVFQPLGNRFGSKKQQDLQAKAKEIVKSTRERKVTTEGVLTGYNSEVKIKLNLIKEDVYE